MILTMPRHKFFYTSSQSVVSPKIRYYSKFDGLVSKNKALFHVQCRAVCYSTFSMCDQVSVLANLCLSSLVFKVTPAMKIFIFFISSPIESELLFRFSLISLLFVNFKFLFYAYVAFNLCFFIFLVIFSASAVKYFLTSTSLFSFGGGVCFLTNNP